MDSTFPLPDIDHPDFLAIDDLLDFSNEEDLLDNSCTSGASSGVAPPPSSATVIGPTASTSVNNGSVSVYIASSSSINPSSQTSSTQQVDKKPAPLSVFDSSDLCVPCDDIAELEWLSNFVEESFSSGDKLTLQVCNSGFGKDQKTTKTGKNNSKNEPFQSTSPVSVLETNAMHSSRDINKTMSSSALSFSPDNMMVPGRARSKRCRSAVCFWNSRILSAEASESILESSSTTSTITAASSDSDMFNAYYEEDEVEDDIDDVDDEDEYVDDQPFEYHHQVHKKDHATFGGKSKKCSKIYDGGKPAQKKPKMNQDVGGPVRKCLHCATTKTPQWRAGPMGPKTLCNACGVRYKSGRLCAEYRPAASPTFDENVHSNSHRRVLEMRKQKGDPIVNGNSSDSSHGHGQQYSKFYYNNDNRAAATSIRE